MRVLARAEPRAHLARTLPAHMIPRHLISVASFPLNTSGKIDRTALPAPNPRPPGRDLSCRLGGNMLYPPGRTRRRGADAI
jgi:hypothetical protein